MFGPALRREMMAKAQFVARRHVMPWLEREEAHAEELYAAVTQRLVKQVNSLVRQLTDRQPGSMRNVQSNWTRNRVFERARASTFTIWSLLPSRPRR